MDYTITIICVDKLLSALFRAWIEHDHTILVGNTFFTALTLMVSLALIWFGTMSLILVPRIGCKYPVVPFEFILFGRIQEIKTYLFLFPKQKGHFFINKAYTGIAFLR